MASIRPQAIPNARRSAPLPACGGADWDVDTSSVRGAEVGANQSVILEVSEREVDVGARAGEQQAQRPEQQRKAHAYEDGRGLAREALGSALERRRRQIVH